MEIVVSPIVVSLFMFFKPAFVPPSTFPIRSGDNGHKSALSIWTDLTADPVCRMPGSAEILLSHYHY